MLDFAQLSYQTRLRCEAFEAARAICAGADEHEILREVATKGTASPEQRLQVLRFTNSMMERFERNCGFSHLQSTDEYLEEVTFDAYRGDLAETVAEILDDPDFAIGGPGWERGPLG